MAINIYGGGCNPCVLIADTDISDMGFNEINTKKVVLPGTDGQPDKSYVPGSLYNTLLGVIPKFKGINIHTQPGQSRDMTALVIGGGVLPDVLFYLQ